MSREIKFRAWHKNTNFMCQDVKTDLLDRYYLEFMQYTGINDTKRTKEYPNGQPIYEGDIVSDGGNVAAVKFGYYKANNNKCYENEKAYGFYLDYISIKGVISHATKLEYFEVIGNIYQDKKLLEGEN